MMTEMRRGTVILIQSGDPEISGAIAGGMMAGRGTVGTSSVSAFGAATFPNGGRLLEPLEPEEIEVVYSALKELRAQAQAAKPQDAPETRGQGSEASCAGRGALVEIDRQEINLHLLRVSVGNNKTAEDYADLLTKARGDYARYSRPAGPVRRLGRRLLAIYGLLCYGVARAYRSQERVLGNSLSRFAAAPSGREPNSLSRFAAAPSGREP